MERIIAVIALWRDSAKYLSTSLRQLEKEAETLSPKYRFFYSFYENDSVDNTPQLLSSWLDKHQGVLLSQTRKDPKWKSVQSIRRTKLMAEYRNLALKGLYEINFDYLFVFDTDITLEEALISRMINILDLNSEIGMITPNTIQNVPDAYQSKSDSSYYDSWALIDIRGNKGLSYASNPFLSFDDRHLWRSGLRINVQSAFGGAALIRGNLFKNGYINWSGDNGCEHWDFCKRIRNLNYLVTVDPLLSCKVNSSKKKKADYILVQYDKSRLIRSQLGINSNLLKRVISNVRYVFFKGILLLKNIIKSILKFFISFKNLNSL